MLLMADWESSIHVNCFHYLFCTSNKQYDHPTRDEKKTSKKWFSCKLTQIFYLSIMDYLQGLKIH